MQLHHKEQEYIQKLILTMSIHFVKWPPTEARALFRSLIPASKVASKSARRDETCNHKLYSLLEIIQSLLEYLEK